MSISDEGFESSKEFFSIDMAIEVGVNGFDGLNGLLLVDDNVHPKWLKKVIEEFGHLLRVEAIAVISIIFVEDFVDVAAKHFILQLLAPYHMYYI